MEPNKALRDYTQIANSQGQMSVHHPSEISFHLFLSSPGALHPQGKQSETRQLKVKIDWRPFAGFQIAQKGWPAVEVAPHTNTRRYFKRMSLRERPN